MNKMENSSYVKEQKLNLNLGLATDSNSSEYELGLMPESSGDETVNGEVEVKDDPKDANIDTESYLDILGSGQLLKKVLEEGREDSRPQRLDICQVEYVAKYKDKIVDEAVVTINAGDADVIQGLDLAIPLMNIGEKAEIITWPRFAYGSQGREPDIPPNAVLSYTVKLLSAEPEPLLETMSLKERKEFGYRKKDRGNYWYSRNDYTVAIQCYRRALEFLDDSGLSALDEFKSVSEDEIHSLLEDKIKTYNNLAQAQLKIKAYDSALQSVENVLRCEPKNVKALYRKGKIMAEKGETEEGISLLKKALALDPDNAEARSILHQLEAKRKLDIVKEKNLYKKMLGANKDVKNVATSPTGEVKRWGMLAGCVGVTVFCVLVAYKWY